MSHLPPRKFPTRPGAPGYLPPESTYTPSDWRVLSRFWHPVAYASEIADRPVAARLLDERLVLFRTSAGVTVASDLCIHRGSSMSRGAVVGDEIVCAYHGFRYGADGACTRIPSQDPGAPIASRLCLSVYPSQVRYGLVWVRLSPEVGQALPAWPELESPDFQVIPLPAVVWRAAAARHVENFNDCAHVGFVHAATFGNPNDTRLRNMVISREDGLLVQRFSYPRIDRDSAGDPAVVRERPVENRVSLPFLSHLRMAKDGGKIWSVYDFVCPASSRQSRIFMIISRNHDFDRPVEAARDFQQLVNDEDRPVVEDQHPEYLPLDLAEEQHVASDQLSVAYRRGLRELGLGANYIS